MRHLTPASRRTSGASRLARRPARILVVARAAVLALVALGAPFVLAGVLAEPAAAQSPSLTVNGTFTYGDRNPDNGVVTPRPIAFATVEVVSCSDPACAFGIWNTEARPTTDGSGTISVQVPYIGPGRKYAVRVFATNYAAQVNHEIQAGPYYAVTPAQFSAAPGQTMSFTTDFADGPTAQHFNIAEAIRHGRDYAAARRDPQEREPIPVVGVKPGPGPTWYNAPADTVMIRYGDTFSDYLLLHEYAHFLEHKIGHLLQRVAEHNGCDAFVGSIRVNSPEYAWMEGFAAYFAGAIALTPAASFLDGHGIFGSDGASSIETPRPCASSPAFVAPEAVEDNVKGTLFDLVDGGGESGDMLSGFDLQVFQIFDRELGTGTAPTIEAFRAAWAARPLSVSGLDQILNLNRIPKSGFAPTEDWGQGVHYGTRGTHFADVTGDGRADSIAVDNDGVIVRRSTGAGFAQASNWTGGPYYAGRGNYFADVTGDGRADAIVVSGSGVTVRRSTGGSFSGNEAWSGPYYGDRGTYFADVTGDAPRRRHRRQRQRHHRPPLDRRRLLRQRDVERRVLRQPRHLLHRRQRGPPRRCRRRQRQRRLRPHLDRRRLRPHHALDQRRVLGQPRHPLRRRHRRRRRRRDRRQRRGDRAALARGHHLHPQRGLDARALLRLPRRLLRRRDRRRPRRRNRRQRLQHHPPARVLSRSSRTRVDAGGVRPRRGFRLATVATPA